MIKTTNPNHDAPRSIQLKSYLASLSDAYLLEDKYFYQLISKGTKLFPQIFDDRCYMDCWGMFSLHTGDHQETVSKQQMLSSHQYFAEQELRKAERCEKFRDQSRKLLRAVSLAGLVLIVAFTVGFLFSIAIAILRLLSLQHHPLVALSLLFSMLVLCFYCREYWR